MKVSLLALLLAGTAAFCQSPASPKVDPDTMFRLPEKFSQAAPEFKQWKSLPAVKNEVILAIPPAALPRPKMDNPEIDPKIILRPPWRSQPNGQDISRNLYPNLKFLPIRRGRPIR